MKEEEEEEVTAALLSTHIKQDSLPEDDSQPTPPPRKKRLKKKLEQVLEASVTKNFEPEHKGQEEQSLQPTEQISKEVSGTPTAETMAEGGDNDPASLDEGKSPKKSRRKKK